MNYPAYVNESFGGKRLSGRLGRPKVISVQFLDKKTGKVRHFTAKVKKPKYLNTREMVKGMAANGMSAAMITQAVMKREKTDKRTAAKMIKDINPKFVPRKKKSASKSKSKSSSSKSKSKSSSSKSKSKSSSSKSKSKSSAKSRKRPNSRPSRRRGGVRTQRQYSLW